MFFLGRPTIANLHLVPIPRRVWHLPKPTSQPSHSAFPSSNTTHHRLASRPGISWGAGIPLLRNDGRLRPILQFSFPSFSPIQSRNHQMRKF